jgi:hypothetical protein
MSGELERLLIRLEADTAQLRTAMTAAEKSVEGYTKKADKALARAEARFQKMGGAATKQLAAVGAGYRSFSAAVAALGAGATVALAKHFIDIGAEMKDTADRLGLTTDALQEWRYAAAQAGVSAADVDGAFEQLSRRLGEIKEGVTPAEESLGHLGLTLKDVSGQPIDEAAKIIFDRLNQLENPLQRANLLTDLFGKNALKMGNLVSAGSEGIKKFADEAKRAGIILDQETLQKAAKAGDEFDTISIALKAAGVRISAEFLPALEAVRDLVASPEFHDGIKNTASAFATLTKWMVENKEIVAALAGAWVIAKFAAGGWQKALLAAGGGLVTYAAASAAATSDVEKLEGELQALKLQLKDANFGPPNQAVLDRITELETLIAKAKEANAEMAALAEMRGTLEEPGHQPQPPKTNTGHSATDEARRAKRYAQTVSDLAFSADLARGKFKGLAEGTAETAHSLELFDVRAQEAFKSTGKLSPQVELLNKRQLDLNGALLTQEMLEPYEIFNQRLARANELLAAGSINAESYNRHVFQLREELAAAGGKGVELNALAGDIAQSFGSSFEDAALKGKSFRDTMVSLLKDIERAMLRALVIQPLENAITGSLGGSGGILNSFLGGGQVIGATTGSAANGGWATTVTQAGPLDSLFAGFRAQGGPVRSGRAYVVGEQGPEIFTPRASGHIVPNDELAEVSDPAGSDPIASADLAADRELARVLALFDGVGGARAKGGPVTGGVPYLVGEEGPEIWVPNLAGRGRASQAGAAAGGVGGRRGEATTVYNIDARGADISVAERIEAALAAAQRAQRSPVHDVAAYQRRFPTRNV